MTAVGQQLLAPESGWRRYDDRHGAFHYINKGVDWAEVQNANNYLGGSTRAMSGKRSELRFDFIGTSLRYLANVSPLYTERVEIDIDGVKQEFSTMSSTSTGQVVVVEVLDLPYGRHKVTVKVVEPKPSNDSYRFEGIDIDSSGRLLHPNEVIDIGELAVGKMLRCFYSSVRNTVGVFTDFSGEYFDNGASSYIPNTSTDVPNGYFYYICVDKDHQGRFKLIADRIIQHTVSWDTLNRGGLITGNTALLSVALNPNDSHSRMTVSDNGNSVTNSYATTNDFYVGVRSILPKKRGKWYFEAKATGYDSRSSITEPRSSIGVVGGAFFLATNTQSPSEIGDEYKRATMNDSSIYSVLLDLDSSTLEIKRDGETVVTESGLADQDWYVAVFSKNGTSTDMNFGQSSFVYSIPEGYLPYSFDSTSRRYEFETKLPTGGVSSQDTENDWDKYIVSSNLGETIAPGDNNVWNWSVPTATWTSSSSNAATDRTRRVARGGQQGGVASYALGTNSEVTLASSTRGFRPMLLIRTNISEEIVMADDLHNVIDTLDVGWVIEGESSQRSFILINELSNTISGIKLSSERVSENDKTHLYLSEDGVTWSPELTIIKEMNSLDYTKVFAKIETDVGMRGDGEFNLKISAIPKV